MAILLIRLNTTTNNGVIKIKKMFKDIMPGDCIEVMGMRMVVISNDVDQMYPERRIVFSQLYSSYIENDIFTITNSGYDNPHEDDVVEFVSSIEEAWRRARDDDFAEF